MSLESKFFPTRVCAFACNQGMVRACTRKGFLKVVDPNDTDD